MYHVPPATAIDPKQLNPWLSMWTRPRTTIRILLDTDPDRHILLLAALSGIAQTLNNAAAQSLGETYSLGTIFLLSFVVGPLYGIIQLYIGAALFGWSGRWLGGTASNAEVRTAMAWSAVPSIWLLGLWVPQLLLFGEELFRKATPKIDTSTFLVLALLGFGIIELLVGIWSVIIFLKSLGEAHRFSAWRALAATSIPLFAIAILIIALVVMLM